MQFLKRNIWTICCLALVLIMATTGDSFAAAGDLVDKAKTKATNVFDAVKTIIFIVGGFGLVGLAFAAIFGKLQWKWFASLAVGLAILAAAGAIVNYATGDTDVTGSTLGDTFGNV